MSILDKTFVNANHTTFSYENPPQSKHCQVENGKSFYFFYLKMVLLLVILFFCAEIAII